MVTQPYFMKDESWYITNEDGEYLLTKNAPKEAVEDYNKRRKEYIDKVRKMSTEEYASFLEQEDSWLAFPI